MNCVKSRIESLSLFHLFRIGVRWYFIKSGRFERVSHQSFYYVFFSLTALYNVPLKLIEYLCLSNCANNLSDGISQKHSCFEVCQSTIPTVALVILSEHLHQWCCVMYLLCDSQGEDPNTGLTTWEVNWMRQLYCWKIHKNKKPNKNPEHGN